MSYPTLFFHCIFFVLVSVACHNPVGCSHSAMQDWANLLERLRASLRAFIRTHIVFYFVKSHVRMFLINFRWCYFNKIFCVLYNDGRWYLCVCERVFKWKWKSREQYEANFIYNNLMIRQKPRHQIWTLFHTNQLPQKFTCRAEAVFSEGEKNVCNKWGRRENVRWVIHVGATNRNKEARAAVKYFAAVKYLDVGSCTAGVKLSQAWVNSSRSWH